MGNHPIGWQFRSRKHPQSTGVETTIDCEATPDVHMCLYVMVAYSSDMSKCDNMKIQRSNSLWSSMMIANDDPILLMMAAIVVSPIMMDYEQRCTKMAGGLQVAHERRWYIISKNLTSLLSYLDQLHLTFGKPADPAITQESCKKWRSPCHFTIVDGDQL